MNYLNLGCGNRYKPNWVNIDFVSYSPDVISHDLKERIPLSDSTLDFVYHSHVLEHFTATDANFLIKECWRVLKPGGVLRVVVPDLENLVIAYLRILNEVREGNSSSIPNYNWIMLELLDQCVRSQLGGGMADYLKWKNIPNSQFVIDRLGNEAKKWLSPSENKIRIIKKKEFSGTHLKSRLSATLRYTFNLRNFREQLLKWCLGNEYSALQLGRFRQSGEIHQWMYDSFSLRQLLTECNFRDIKEFEPATSYLPGWPAWNLDVEADGSPYRPNSIYMEGIK